MITTEYFIFIKTLASRQHNEITSRIKEPPALDANTLPLDYRGGSK